MLIRRSSRGCAEDNVGISVALVGDTLAVGAYGEDCATTSSDSDHSNNAASTSGAVCVFH